MSGLDGSSTAGTERLLDKLLRRAADSTTDGVAVASMDHRLVYVNRALAQMHGYEEDELAGGDERALRTSEDVPDEVWQCAMQESRWEGEGVGLRKDGSSFPVERTVQCVRGRDGQPIGMLTIIRDLSAVRQAEREYRELVENASAGVYRSTLDGRFLYINGAGAAMFGAADPAELMSRLATELYVDPAQRERLIDRLKREGSVSGYSARMQTLRGEPLVVLLSATLIDGELSGMMIDMTAQQRSEQELERTARQLASLLETSRELNSTLDTRGVLRELVEHSLALVNAYSGAAGLVVDGSRVVFDEQGVRGQWVPREESFSKGHGVPGWVLEHGRPYLTNNASEDPQVIPHLQKEMGYEAVLGVPIRRSDGQMLGCLVVYAFPGERHFDESDVRLLTGLANQGAVALNNALLADNLRHYTQELERSEETLRLVVEGSPDLFFYIHDTDGIFSYVSGSVENITGHTTEEWKSHYTSFMTANPINVKAIEFTEKTLKTGEITPSYPVEVAHKDGRTVVLEVYERPIIRDGQVDGIRGVARDITELRRAEERETRLQDEAEAQKRRFYRDTIFSVTDGKLFICDEADVAEQSGAPLFPPIRIQEPADVAMVRGQIRRAAEKAGVVEDQIDKLVLAVGEAGTNAPKHAGGGTVSMSNGGSVVRVTVHDSGEGMDSLALPMITLRKGFSTQRSLGMGYAAILASADRVYLSTGPRGTVVVIEVAKLPSRAEVELANLPDLW